MWLERAHDAQSRTLRRIGVLMTSFNRREYTLRALRGVFAQREIGTLELTVFLVDDASTDGTEEGVRAEFPEVRVLRGDGSLYWNRGMRVAFAAAMQEGFDAYLLLNDDTMLSQDAVQRLVGEYDAQARAGVTSIVVGSTRSAETGELSYGGMRVRRHGLTVAFEEIAPDAEDATPCETMNGNIVLIPAAVAEEVGNLEERFHHHFGDLDYGLRARRAGFAVVIAAGYLGECGNNSTSGTWRDTALPLRTRWKKLQSPKGQPFAEWLLFTHRHYGWRWLYYAWSPYVKTIASGLLARLHGNTAKKTAIAGN